MATRISCVPLLLALIGLTPIVCHAQTPPAVQKHDPQAERLRVQAYQSEDKHSYPAAIALFTQAYARDKTKFLLDASKDQNDIGYDLLMMGQDQKGIACFQKALVLLKSSHDPEGLATTYNNLGAAYDHLKQYNKSVVFYQKALPLFLKSKDFSSLARALNNLSEAYLDLKQYDEALSWLEVLQKLMAGSPDQDENALILKYMGDAYKGQGDSLQAQDYFQKAAALFHTTHNQHGEAGALYLLGETYADLSQHETAISTYEQALVLYRQLSLPSDEATVLNDEGISYSALSQYPKALDVLNQSLSISQAQNDQDGMAATNNNLGEVYLSLTQYSKASDFYQQALKLFQSNHDPDGAAAALNNLGSINSTLAHPQNALHYFQQALALEAQRHNTRAIEPTLDNIGSSYLDLKEYSAAITFFQQALSLAQQIHDLDGEGAALDHLGLASDAQKKYDLGVSFYQQALTIAREIHNREGESIALYNLMSDSAAQNEPRLAIYYGKQAVNVYQSIRQDNQGLGKDTQKSYLQDKEPTYRELAELLIQQGRLPEAEQVLGLLKDEELKDFVQRDSAQLPPAQQTLSYDPAEQAQKDSDATLSAAVTAISAQIEELKRKKPLTLADAKQLTLLQDQLQPAQAKFQAFLTALPKELPPPTQNAPDPGQALLDKSLQGPFQKTLFDLGAGTVAIYTIVETDKVRIVLVTSQTQVAREYAITRDDLRTKVEDFRKALQEPDVDPRPYAHALYTILIGPIEDDLKGAQATTLMWSLDDDLRYIPMDALYDGKQYLIERYPSTEFTGASLAGLETAPPAQYTVLGLGVSQAHPGGYPALPGVPQELNGIVKDAQNTTGVMDGAILLDSQLTWDALKTDLNLGYPVVHIASHFDLGADYAHSFLLLGDGPHSLDELSSQSQIFQSADLLTLSACDTGLGGMTGDGHEIESFGALAQEKGAQSIIASLWPVADSSTPLLMDDFYRQLAQGHISKAEALRQAQLSLLHGAGTGDGSTNSRAKVIPDSKTIATPHTIPFAVDPKAPYAHPYYWAPFILIGNWK